MTMINDSHCHFFSPRFLDLIAPDGGGHAAIAERLQWEDPGSPAELASRWIRELDAHGVMRAVLIASVPGDESSVAEAIAAHPDRFVGFFMHNPVAPGAEEVRQRWLASGAFRGISLFPAMHGYRLDEPCVERVFAAAQEHGAAVFAHCGVLTVGVRKKLGLSSRFDLRLGDPLALSRMALGFPRVPVIVPHFGAGFFREALMAADQCPSIHLDTSSSNGWTKFHPGLTLEDVFRQALTVLGAERLLFGTDSSFFPRGWVRGVFDQQRQILDSLGAGEPAKQLIFAGNFDRLFPSRSV